MKIDDVRRTAFAMPLASPAFPPGPYRLAHREFLIVTYRTAMDALRAVVPEPLEVVQPLVRYEFIRIPNCIPTRWRLPRLKPSRRIPCN